MRLATFAAGLAGGIVMFLLGFLFYAVLFATYFQENMVQYAGLMKDPPVFWAIFVFNIVWAFLIAFVLDHWAKLSGWAEGAKTGAIIMFLVGLATNLDFYAFLNLHKALAPVIVHLIVMIILGAGAGATAGVVLGFFNRRTAED
ncbi:MAG: hypothetical protein IPM25_06225 [Chloracidobacterium sp.]|nr:hypothetical protein [Chloracidobacterium sp.]